MNNGNPNPFAIEAIVNQDHILELYQFKLLVAFFLLQELFMILAPFLFLFIYLFFLPESSSDCIVSLEGIYVNLCYRR